MAFTYLKDDFFLEGNSVNCMFSFSDGVQLNISEYCEEICQKFGNAIKCSIKMDRNKCNLNSFVFNVSCLINKDFKYSLKCYKNDIKSGHKLKFEVLCSLNTLCHHGSIIEGRPLKGSARKDVQNKLLNKTPKQVNIYLLPILFHDFH